MTAFSIKKIEDGFVWLRKEFEDTGEIQSIDILIQKLDAINASLAWSGEQMAVAKKLLNEAKEKAYLTLSMSSEAQQKYYAPSLAKDYISARCSNENYNYDMAERFYRTTFHISQNLITAISALKEMAKVESFAQNVPSR